MGWKMRITCGAGNSGRNTLNFLGRCLFSLLRQFGGFPDEYYNAKDLGDGNVQKLFGSEKQRKRSWWRP